MIYAIPVKPGSILYLPGNKDSNYEPVECTVTAVHLTKTHGNYFRAEWLRPDGRRRSSNFTFHVLGRTIFYRPEDIEKGER